jgi:hypothetical protein
MPFHGCRGKHNLAIVSITIPYSFQALDQVRIRRQRPPNGNQVGLTGGKIAFGASGVVTAGEEERALERLAIGILDRLRHRRRAHERVIDQVDVEQGSRSRTEDPERLPDGSRYLAAVNPHYGRRAGFPPRDQVARLRPAITSRRHSRRRRTCRHGDGGGLVRACSATVNSADADGGAAAHAPTR